MRDLHETRDADPAAGAGRHRHLLSPSARGPAAVDPAALPRVSGLRAKRLSRPAAARARRVPSVRSVLPAGVVVFRPARAHDRGGVAPGTSRGPPVRLVHLAAVALHSPAAAGDRGPARATLSV